MCFSLGLNGISEAWKTFVLYIFVHANTNSRSSRSTTSSTAYINVADFPERETINLLPYFLMFKAPFLIDKNIFSILCIFII